MKRRKSPLRLLAWVGAVAMSALIVVVVADAIVAFMRAFWKIPPGVFTGVVVVVIVGLLAGTGVAITLFLMSLPRRARKAISQDDDDNRGQAPKARRFAIGRGHRHNDDNGDALSERTASMMRHRIIEGTWGEPTDVES